MHKSILKFSLAFFMVLCLSTTASASTIGAFSSMEVLQKSAMGIAAQNEIQKKFGSEGEKLEKELAAIQKEIADFQKQAPALSESARNAKAQELDGKMRAHQEKRNNLANNFTPFQNSIQSQIQETLVTACANYAKANNFDIIMDNAGIMAYLNPDLDVTKAIIVEMDKLWKSKGSKFK